MKRDVCLPKGEPPTGPRHPDAFHRGYSIFKVIGGRGEVAYRKPNGIARDAKSVTLAMTAIDKLEGKAPRSSGAVLDDGMVKTFRIVRDIDQREVSRKVVEARDKKDQDA